MVVVVVAVGFDGGVGASAFEAVADTVGAAVAALVPGASVEEGAADAVAVAAAVLDAVTAAVVGAAVVAMSGFTCGSLHPASERPAIAAIATTSAPWLRCAQNGHSDSARTWRLQAGHSTRGRIGRAYGEPASRGKIPRRTPLHDEIACRAAPPAFLAMNEAMIPRARRVTSCSKSRRVSAKLGVNPHKRGAR